MSRSVGGRAAMLGLGVLSVFIVAGAAAAELKVGDPAPAFSLQGSDGKTYTLEQFKGKSAVVIAWFPKAFTGGCTKECKSLRENSKALHDLKVAYFTASVDTPEENKKFAKSLDLDYPILSDPDKSVAKAYGVLNRGARLRQSLDVLHRQGRDHQGDRQEGQGRQGRRGHRRQAQGAGARLGLSRAVALGLPGRRLSASDAALGLQLGPAPLQLAQDSPEQPAVHQAGDPSAASRAERVRLGVLEMVRDLVEERVEELFQRPPAIHAVVGVNPDQASRLVIAAQHALGRPCVDVH